MSDVSPDTVIANLANVSSGGTSYAVGDTVILEGGSGTAPTYTVASVTSAGTQHGAVTDLTLLSAGDLTAFPANPGSFSTTGSGTGLLADIYLAGTPRSLANRASDNINVEDFGAAVDGKNTDTPLILVAYNATPNNGILNIPAGNFLEANFQTSSFSGSFTGSISATTLTVSDVITGAVGAGSILSGPGISTTQPPPVVLSQISGTTNGAGTYQISSAENVSSGTTLQANKSILIKTLGSLDLGTAAPGTSPVGSLGDGNVLEAVYNGSKYFGKTTTLSTNGYAALLVDFTTNNRYAGFGSSSYVNSGITCNAMSNFGTPASGETTGIWAICGKVTVNDSTNDNYGMAAICTLGTCATSNGAAFYAQTKDNVGGTVTTGVGEFDLFTFGSDAIHGTNVDYGMRCLLLARLQFQSNRGTDTSAQASRGIEVSAGTDSSNAIGAMFHGNGQCYYAVFNASNTTSVAGSPVAALRMPLDMGIDFSTVAGSASTLNNRVLLYNSSSKNLEYQVATGTPATAPVFSITDEGSVIVTGAAIQEASTGTYAADYRPNFDVQGNFSLVLTGNIMLINPLSVTPGAQGYILLTQGGTGGNTISFGTGYVFPGGIKPILSTAAGAIDMLNYTAISSTQIAVVLVAGLAS